LRKLLNSLYVLSEDVYLTLEGENVVILREKEITGRFPLHTLESILCFSYKGASPALMGHCAYRDVSLCFFTPRGRFLCRSTGAVRGNVLLRQMQFRYADMPDQSCTIARGFVIGKLWNQRQVLLRALRDHPQRVDSQALSGAADNLAQLVTQVEDAFSTDSLRGLEGTGAKQYFDQFNHLILQNQEAYHFGGRSRRPPLDRTNAALSFVYTLLANDCASALEGVGLDPYVGFLHTARPGRASLALDLMEELRPMMADRVVLSLINTRALVPNQFDVQENGAVFLNENGRKTVLSAWQQRKTETITHPFLQEKVDIGLLPHVQALLLARFLRGDIDAYPPFLWR
jgi:CRISPR-associated protein Cas1